MNEAGYEEFEDFEEQDCLLDNISYFDIEKMIEDILLSPKYYDVDVTTYQVMTVLELQYGVHLNDIDIQDLEYMVRETDYLVKRARENLIFNDGEECTICGNSKTTASHVDDWKYQRTCHACGLDCSFCEIRGDYRAKLEGFSWFIPFEKFPDIDYMTKVKRHQIDVIRFYRNILLGKESQTDETMKKLKELQQHFYSENHLQ